MIRPTAPFALVACLGATTACVSRRLGPIAPVSSDVSATDARPSASPRPIDARSTAARPPLRRGINLGDALDAPSEGEWGVVLRASDFATVAAAGFDHVRLPVRFNAHAARAAPFSIDRAFFERVDWAVKQALGHGLAVVLDFHHYEELMADPNAHRARFVALWRQIAERYASAPPQVAFELLNEPHEGLVAGLWNEILDETLRVVRASNPARTVVVEGVFWASAKNLRDTLVVPEGDANLVGSFHMYQPILFTHQGADWMPPEYQTRGVVFPGPPPAPLTPAPSASAVTWVNHWFERYNREPAATNPDGVATITEQLDMARSWSDRHKLPVYLGEFGADDVADLDSRVRWTQATRLEAEKRGFGWAYWDDGGHFAAFDRKSGAWVPALRAALLP